MRIAQVAPLFESVPPKYYALRREGGAEIINVKQALTGVQYRDIVVSAWRATSRPISGSRKRRFASCGIGRAAAATRSPRSFARRSTAIWAARRRTR